VLVGIYRDVFMKEFFLVCFLISTLTGAYFHLQLMGYMKEGHQLSRWSGRWLFHPEWFELEGKSFYRKLIINMVITLFLLLLYQFD